MINKMKRLAITLFCVAVVSTASAGFDGNNKADIFVTNATGLHWYQASGIGYGVTYTTRIYNGTNATAVAVDDFDGDAALDLFLGKSGTSGTWYEATGEENGITWVMNIGTNVRPNGLAVGNYDGDDKGDLLVSRATGYYDWYESNGNNATTYVSGFQMDAVSLTLGDFDGDMYNDLFAGRSAAINWYEARADNTATWVRNFGTANIKASVVGDLDGNGASDLIVVKSDGNIMWYEAGGDNAVPATRGTDILSGATTVAMGDFNNDGVMNLLVGTASGVNIYKASGSGTLTWLGNFSSGQIIGIAIVPVAREPKADFDGNGQGDVFVAATTDMTRVQWWQNTDWRHLDYTNVSFGAGASALMTGDFDGDGIQDLLVGRGPSTGSSCTWYKSNGKKNGMSLIADGFATNAIDFDYGDINGDGFNDLLIVRDTSGSTQLARYSIKSPNTLTYESTTNLTAGMQCVAIGDIDGNYGGVDVLIGKSSAISWYEFNPSTNAFTWIQNWNNNSAKKIIIGNFDDDQWPDIIFIDQTGRLRWWETHPMENGVIWIEGNDTDNTQIPDNTGYVDMAIVDLDGDGLNEVLAAKEDGTVHWIAAKSALSGATVHGIWGIVATQNLGAPLKAIAAVGLFGPEDLLELMPCGDGIGYLQADINQDCMVGFDDFVLFAEKWLQ